MHRLAKPTHLDALVPRAGLRGHQLPGRGVHREGAPNHPPDRWHHGAAPRGLLPRPSTPRWPHVHTRVAHVLPGGPHRRVERVLLRHVLPVGGSASGGGLASTAEGQVRLVVVVRAWGRRLLPEALALRRHDSPETRAAGRGTHAWGARGRWRERLVGRSGTLRARERRQRSEGARAKGRAVGEEARGRGERRRGRGTCATVDQDRRVTWAGMGRGAGGLRANMACSRPDSAAAFGVMLVAASPRTSPPRAVSGRTGTGARWPPFSRLLRKDGLRWCRLTHGCLRRSMMPGRWDGSFMSDRRIQSWASSDIHVGKRTSELRMARYVSSRDARAKGGAPTRSSYARMPHAHESTSDA